MNPVEVSESASRQADAEVRVFSQHIRKPQLRIGKDRRHRQAQRDIGLPKPGLVEEVEGVTRDRPLAFERLVVSQLQQLTFHRINLRVCRKGNDEQQQEGKQTKPAGIHGQVSAAFRRAQQA